MRANDSGSPPAMSTQFPPATRRLSQMSPPLQGTQSAANAIGRVKYTHDAMIDLIIANPAISQNEIARHFGYTAAWVSRVFNSDAFQARLAVRKFDIVDPALVLSVDEKLRTLASRSLDVVLERMESAPKTQDALAALSIATKALGYGARQSNVSLQANFVVAMPEKLEDANVWQAKYSGAKGGVGAESGLVPAAADSSVSRLPALSAPAAPAAAA